MCEKSRYSIPMPCLCGTGLWKFAFLFGLAGLQLKVTERKCIEHTVRLSVVRKTHLKTEGEQPNYRETEYREYRFKRNSRRNEENECLKAWCDWIELKVWFCGLASWFAFVLFNLYLLFSFFFSMKTHSLGPGSAVGEQRRKNWMIDERNDRPSDSPSRPLSPLSSPIFAVSPRFLPLPFFVFVSRSFRTQKIRIYSVPR